jgi:hypothetical protein
MPRAGLECPSGLRRSELALRQLRMAYRWARGKRQNLVYAPIHRRADHRERCGWCPDSDAGMLRGVLSKRRAIVRTIHLPASASPITIASAIRTISQIAAPVNIAGPSRLDVSHENPGSRQPNRRAHALAADGDVKPAAPEADGRDAALAGVGGDAGQDPDPAPKA